MQLTLCPLTLLPPPHLSRTSSLQLARVQQQRMLQAASTPKAGRTGIKACCMGPLYTHTGSPPQSDDESDQGEEEGQGAARAQQQQGLMLGNALLPSTAHTILSIKHGLAGEITMSPRMQTFHLPTAAAAGALMRHADTSLFPPSSLCPHAALSRRHCLALIHKDVSLFQPPFPPHVVTLPKREPDLQARVPRGPGPDPRPLSPIPKRWGWAVPDIPRGPLAPLPLRSPFPHNRGAALASSDDAFCQRNRARPPQ